MIGVLQSPNTGDNYVPHNGNGEIRSGIVAAFMKKFLAAKWATAVDFKKARIESTLPAIRALFPYPP
jgi:hypothetical protein